MSRHLLLFFRFTLVLILLNCTCRVFAQSSANCNTMTYRMEIKAPEGGKIELLKLKTTLDGHFLAAIRETMSNGDIQSGLALIENDGQIGYKRVILVNGNHVKLSDIDILQNGSILATGYLNDGSNLIFLTRFRSDLSPEWSKIYETQNPPLKILVRGEHKDNSAFIAIQHLDMMTVIHADNGGEITWAKDVAIPGLKEVTGIFRSDDLPIHLSANVETGGTSKMLMIELNNQNGGLANSAYLDDNGTNHKILSHTKFSRRSHILSWNEMSNGDWLFNRTIHFSTGVTETKHSFTIPATQLTKEATAAVENPGNTLVLSTPANRQLTFFQLYGDYNFPPGKIRAYEVPENTEVISVVSGTDAGYLIGSNVNAGERVLFLKTDSIGTLPGCGFKDVVFPFEEKRNVDNIKTGIIAADQNNIVASSTASSLTAAQLPIPEISCKQTYCPSIPIEKTCTPSFQKSLRTYGFTELLRSNYIFGNENQVILAYRQDRSRFPSPEETYSLQLYDPNGNFIKGKILNEISGDPSIDGIDPEHFMVTSTVAVPTGHKYTFALMNKDLEVIWSKSRILREGLFATTTGFLKQNVQRDQEGNYYIFGLQAGLWAIPSKLWVYKMDKDGEKIWEKIYLLNNHSFFSSAMAITNSALIINIDCFLPNRGVSVRINKNTGNIDNSYSYNSMGSNTYNVPTMKYTKGHILYAGNNDEGTLKMLLFDTAGKPLKQVILEDYGRTTAGIISNGEISVVLHNYSNGFGKVILKADTSLQILSALRYPLETFEVPTSLSTSPSGSLYETGYINSSLGSYAVSYMSKYTPSGVKGNCQYTAVQPIPTQVDPDPSPINFTESTVNSSEVPSDFDASRPSEGQQIAGVLCQQNTAASCTAPLIEGPEKICDISKEYEFKALQEESCTDIIYWETDQEGAQIKRTGRNTVNISFSRVGTVTLSAYINNGCEVLRSEFKVAVQSSTVTSLISDEKDKLCRNDSAVLSGQEGFQQYFWSTGSHDREILVKEPGKYFLDVLNACGNPISDTIIISAWDEPVLDLGNDTAVCMNTSYETEQNGFSTYTWTLNQEKISNENHVSFPINIHSELIAEVVSPEGCPLKDTLNLQALDVPEIQLRNDTSICAGEMIMITANPDFDSYEWNTGASTADISANAAGLYKLKAVAFNGCIAKDSVLLQTYPLPVVQLGADGVLCEGGQKSLDPGLHEEYLWHNGSSDRFFEVGSSGQFWVKVKNGFGCSASDTITVTDIRPLPVGFLPSSDSLCAYETKILQPNRNFASYSWNNSSTQRSISIDQPGSYRLTVTDQSGCQGTEEINIYPKNCLEGIFVPNSFTPNNDGFNDRFKPIIHATVRSYHLSIYNRWGEPVYSTRNTNEGWNGIYKGTQVPPGVYVWKIRYQFEGGASQLLKGTLTLIR